MPLIALKPLSRPPMLRVEDIPEEIVAMLEINPETGLITSNKMMGINETRHRGGRAGGYQVLILVNGAYYVAHRLAARLYGWQIEGLDVHHINENPADNRRCNLQVLTKAEHGRLHRDGQWPQKKEEPRQAALPF